MRLTVEVLEYIVPKKRTSIKFKEKTSLVHINKFIKNVEENRDKFQKIL